MKSSEEIKSLIDSCGVEAMSLLEKIGALYVRPYRGVDPIGPLVGRQSTYPMEENSGVGHHYVSEHYFLGDVLCQYPLVFDHLARLIAIQMDKNYIDKGLDYIGLGLGGTMLAAALVHKINGTITTINTERVIIVQDILEPRVLEQVIRYVKSENKKIACVCCIINSDQGYDNYLPITSLGPVRLISLIKQLLVKYRQDHPLVADDVTKGNVVWDPKKNWPKLAEVMEEAYAGATR